MQVKLNKQEIKQRLHRFIKGADVHVGVFGQFVVVLTYECRGHIHTAAGASGTIDNFAVALGKALDCMYKAHREYWHAFFENEAQAFVNRLLKVQWYKPVPAPKARRVVVEEWDKLGEI